MNNELHRSVECCPPHLVLWANQFVAVYREAQSGDARISILEIPHTWKPPDTGVIKLNIDAAFPVAVDFFRISLVARNSLGECIW